MEVKKFVISAKYSEFKTFLNDFLFTIYQTSVGRPIEMLGSNSRINLQYPFLGTLFVYEIFPVGENLDITLSVSRTISENVQIHIDEVVEAIRKKFSSAKLPLGFKNLISENGYSSIMEERWSESEKTQRAGAYLSTIILLGSILEGVLLYKIKDNMERANRATSSPKETKTKAVLSFDKWTLADMINVCSECGWVSKNTKSFSDGVRDYRNFVHVWKQLENNLSMPDNNTCEISRKVVESVLEDLLKNSKGKLQ